MSPEQYAALDDLYEQNGRLTPPEYVAAAKPTTSPLHSTLTWDDAVAGEKWRLEEARTNIRSYEVQIVQVPGAPKVQKYVSVQVKPNVYEYHRTEAVMVNDSYREVFIGDLLRSLRVLRQKAEAFQLVAEFRAELLAEASK